MAGNVLVQLSPFPQATRWEARKSTGETDAAPYVSICFGGWQWCFYGMFAYLVTKRSGFLVLLHANCLGAVLGTYYTMLFYRNCQDTGAKTNLQKYLSAVAALVLLQLCGLLTLPAERSLFLSGLVSSFCSFMGALSMLVTVPQVLATQNARSIPGMLAGANLMSSLVWLICGYILADPLVMLPNLMGAASSGICLGLKLRLPSMEEEGPEELASCRKKLSHLENEFVRYGACVEKMKDKDVELEPRDAAAPVPYASGGTGETL